MGGSRDTTTDIVVLVLSGEAPIQLVQIYSGTSRMGGSRDTTTDIVVLVLSGEPPFY